MSKNTCSVGISLLILFTCFFPQAIFAQDCNSIVTDATVVNGNVNLRSRTPYFSILTLIEFKLTQGDRLKIIFEGTRIKVLERKEIVDKYEWFHVEFCENEVFYKGWMFSGKIGDRKYIQFDDPNNPVLSQNKLKAENTYSLNILSLIISEAMANPETIDGPEIKTNEFKTLLLGLLYVVVFITSLIITRRYIFPDSAMYSFLTSFSVLLILGFISSNQLTDIIAKAITK